MNGKRLFKKLINGAILGWLILAGFTFQLFAGTSVKTFDFGAGGDNPTFRSHARSFAPPQNVAIVIAVSYRTNGDSPIAVIVEVEDTNGKNLASREISVEKNAQRVVINISASENTIYGCEKSWQVRIRTKSGEVPTARIYGDISFSFVDPSATEISQNGSANFKLSKGEQLARQIGDANSLNHPGGINIRAGWLDSLAAQASPLKFELVRPDGTVAKTLTGYGTNSPQNPKLDFNYNVGASDAKQNGTWQLRITNSSDRDLIEIVPKILFTRKCFE